MRCCRQPWPHRATPAPAFHFLGTDSEDVLGWSEFFAETERVAAWLQGARGVGPGRRVVVLALPERSMVTVVVAVWLAGGIVSCAPTPARTVDLATYVEQTRGRIAALGDPLVVLGSPYEHLADALAVADAHVDLLDGVVTADPTGVWKEPELTPADPAVLQFTLVLTGRLFDGDTLCAEAESLFVQLRTGQP